MLCGRWLTRASRRFTHPAMKRLRAGISAVRSSTRSLSNGCARPMSDSIIDAIGNTPLVRLQRLSACWGAGASGSAVELLLKLEGVNPTGSIKSRAAAQMMVDAVRRGDAVPGVHTVVESSSGNTAVALAMVCARMGLSFVAVVDAQLSDHRLALLRAYGARIELVGTKADSTNALKQMRRERVQQLRASDPNAFVPDQYDNPANPMAHTLTTAPELVAQLSAATHVPPHAVVIACSTGGQALGLSRYLRSRWPATRIVGVEPLGSQLFGGGAQPYAASGSGLNSESNALRVMVRDGLLDAAYRVADRDSFAAMRALARYEGISAGISTGQVTVAALYEAELASRATVSASVPARVIGLSADFGDHYLHAYADASAAAPVVTPPLNALRSWIADRVDVKPAACAHMYNGNNGLARPVPVIDVCEPGVSHSQSPPHTCATAIARVPCKLPAARETAYDAVVVGGGIVGASTALHLVHGGARVCVIDDSAGALNASGRMGQASAAGAGVASAAASYTKQFALDTAWLDFARAAERYNAQLFGRRNGGADSAALHVSCVNREYDGGAKMLLVATDPAQLPAQRRARQRAAEVGALQQSLTEVPLHTAKQMHPLFGFTNGAAHGSVLEVSGAAAVDGGRLLQRLREAAVQRGVHWLPFSATAVEWRSPERVSGVLTNGRQRLSADHVVLATGAAAESVCGLLPPSGSARALIRRLLYAQRGELLRVRLPPLSHAAAVAALPIVSTFDGHYAVPVAQSAAATDSPCVELLLGTTREEQSAELSGRHTASGALRILRYFERVLAPDAFARATIVGLSSGDRPMTRDYRPIIGRAADTLHLASGFGSDGLLLGTFAGKRLADCILRGTATPDIEPFGLTADRLARANAIDAAVKY